MNFRYESRMLISWYFIRGSAGIPYSLRMFLLLLLLLRQRTDADEDSDGGVVDTMPIAFTVSWLAKQKPFPLLTHDRVFLIRYTRILAEGNGNKTRNHGPSLYKGYIFNRNPSIRTFSYGERSTSIPSNV